MWPYDPSPRRNPLFIQYGFRIVEKTVHNIEEEKEAAITPEETPDEELK